MIVAIIVILLILLLIYLGKSGKLNIYKVMTRFSVFITFGSLFLIVGYVIIKGLPHLKLSMFSLNYTSENVSMLPSIITTLIVVALSILIAAPIGIFTAIYLVEYSKKNSKIVEVIRLATETLQGIPSIVYGLFGMLFFVLRMGLKYSILSGVFTISIMILPLIIRSTEEALKSVSDNIRQASFALGAGKLRTIFRIVIPVAVPGIISGIVLATGRIVGETACLIYTLGTATSLPTSLNSSSRTLALHMYMLSTEGMHVGEAYATGTVLLLLVLLINYISNKLASKFAEVKS
ncbi:phosphate transport system permease protein [Anaerosphaera aminiphila DSM 21120]|uniref:Phosphate transport system permease protein PstA n=1 Tax=Anaerosphaera aminiphila DSM 21120 TaxID=1120995 RepID=A0A1M5QN87_9FIRM|nr:phosphate ABC transporter permease PstA [Anaerosphaera aminiphila]SHH15210.1 phosphate transport system permease protein [Anaerosphaera aminiphila DSM 21120]